MYKTFLVSISAAGVSLRLPFLVLYLMESILLKKKMGTAARHQHPMPFARRSGMFTMELLPRLCWKEEHDADGFFLPTLRTPSWGYFSNTLLHFALASLVCNSGLCQSLLCMVCITSAWDLLFQLFVTSVLPSSQPALLYPPLVSSLQHGGPQWHPETPLFSPCSCSSTHTLCCCLQGLCYHTTPMLLCTTLFFKGHKLELLAATVCRKIMVWY